MASADSAVAATHFRRSLETLERAVVDAGFMGEVLAIAGACERALRDGGKLLLAGNVGSAADAQHIAGEFRRGFCFDRNPLPAVALTTDSSVLTAVGTITATTRCSSARSAARPARRCLHRLTRASRPM
jgi:D-sedoheptulose 7-phosphate isomerase